MPIYEYKCEKCGYEFEQLQKISEKPLLECPKCGELKLRKLISVAGFQLKGSGWYATDFKDKDKKKISKKPEENKTCPVDGKKCSGCSE